MLDLKITDMVNAKSKQMDCRSSYELSTNAQSVQSIEDVEINCGERVFRSRQSNVHLHSALLAVVRLILSLLKIRGES